MRSSKFIIVDIDSEVNLLSIDHEFTYRSDEELHIGDSTYKVIKSSIVRNNLTIFVKKIRDAYSSDIHKCNFYSLGNDNLMIVTRDRNECISNEFPVYSDCLTLVRAGLFEKAINLIDIERENIKMEQQSLEKAEKKKRWF